MERGGKIFGVFRVKNHDFTQTIFFSNLRAGGGGGGGGHRVRPPLDPPLVCYLKSSWLLNEIIILKVALNE